MAGESALASVYANAKAKIVSEIPRMRLRKKLAMIRGVSCALASCTVTSMIERTKTMNVSMDATSAARTARAL